MTMRCEACGSANTTETQVGDTQTFKIRCLDCGDVNYANANAN